MKAMLTEQHSAWRAIEPEPRYIVEPTGNVVGLRPSCKVGDGTGPPPSGGAHGRLGPRDACRSQTGQVLHLGECTQRCLRWRRGSCVRWRSLQALQSVEQRLVQELKRLDTIRSAAEKISKQAEAIEKEVAIGERKLGNIIADAMKTLTALNVELRDEELERVSPIELDVTLPDNDLMLAVAD